ncbi:hypothetical protein [Maridesulfovibrio sp. FT414]|uniref:hypothetical protein n=1 Tax=Maridesulfovibrio sp. FT414 TaxID=2979469 RepID=UPI003D801565
MKFNLENLNPGTWFNFDDSNPESGRICVRRLNAATGKRLSRECTSTVRKFSKGKPYEVSEFNEDQFDLRFYDYVIVDWEGVEDENGTPIPCTAENKKVLAQESIFFQGLIAEAMEKLEIEQAEKEEAAEKN